MNESNINDILKSVDYYRIEMYELALDKGISDPDVLKLSQYLDEKVMKIMFSKKREWLHRINK